MTGVDSNDGGSNDGGSNDGGGFVSRGFDNIGDYHRRIHSRLQRAHRAGTAVTARVNPEQPRQAVLDRSLRRGRLVLAATFPLVFRAGIS